MTLINRWCSVNYCLFTAIFLLMPDNYKQICLYVVVVRLVTLANVLNAVIRHGNKLIN